MTEEEYFRKNYPDFCYGDRLLSPYWDCFQDGVEFGERQSEKKIEELEKENAELRNNGFTVSAMTEQQLKVALEKGEQLEKENAELKKKIGIYQKGMYEEIEKRDKKLTKAKELLKEAQVYIENIDDDSDKFYDEINEFIKEIEK